VVVIAHQAPGPHSPIEVRADPTQILDERLSVIVVEEDFAAGVTACHHVVEGAFEFDAEGSGHRGAGRLVRAL